MFQALFKKAEATVDNAIAGVMWRVVVAIPFLVAVGFGAAALSSVLNEELGPTKGNVVMAGIFCAIGLIAAAIAASRVTTPPAETQPQSTSDATPEIPATERAAPTGDAIDHEMMAAAISTVGPIAVPVLIRTALRNLPLILAVVAAGFVLSRDTESHSASLQAGE